MSAIDLLATLAMLLRGLDPTLEARFADLVAAGDEDGAEALIRGELARALRRAS